MNASETISIAAISASLAFLFMEVGLTFAGIVWFVIAGIWILMALAKLR